MKVGLLDTLGSRYLRFWEPYLRDLGVELLKPQLPKAEAYQLGRESLAGEPPPVQLALGRVLELARADLVVLPQVAGPEGDPWGEALPEVLSRRVSSLPPLQAVPEGGTEAASAAAELGTRLTRTPGLVRRALDRFRPLLSETRAQLPDLSVPNRRTVAVIGPEALLSEPYLLGTLPARLEALGLHAVYSSQVPRATVFERGLRAGAATPAERELAGAQLALEGKSAVRGVLFAVPARSGAWHSLAARLAGRGHKPSMVLDLSPERDEWRELESFAARVGLGAAARPKGEV